MIRAARRKSRHDESNRRVLRPRQRRVGTITARNVVSRHTLLVLPVNLNPVIGNSEWRSSWFSSVRHDPGNILNRPRYGLIRFAGKHISLSLWYCTTYNVNSCHIWCGADLVWVICPPCVPRQNGPLGTLPYSSSSEMSEVVSFSSVSVWPNNLRIGLPPVQYFLQVLCYARFASIFSPISYMNKVHIWTKINVSVKLQCAEFQSYLRYFERMVVEILYVSAESL